MKEQEIKYSGTEKESGEKFSGTVTMRIPESLEEAVQMWGEEVIYSKALGAIVIQAQNLCRGFEGDQEKAQETLNTWVPGVSRVRAGGSKKSLAQKLASRFSEEELEALLSKYEEGEDSNGEDGEIVG